MNYKQKNQPTRISYGPFGVQKVKKDIEFIFDSVLSLAIMPSDRIVAKKLQKQIHIFGGFVRDMIRGVAYADIDIYIPNKEHTMRYITMLRSVGLLKELNTPDNFEAYCVKKLVVMSPTGNLLKIDIVCPTPTRDISRCCDFTVNNLALYADGTIKSRLPLEIDGQKINDAESTLGCLQDCFKGELVLIANNSNVVYESTQYAAFQRKMSARMDKMLAKGFHFNGQSITGFQLRVPMTFADLSLPPTGEDGRGHMCSICHEEYNANPEKSTVVLVCNHHFHDECLDSWRVRSTQCPLCRGNLATAFRAV